MVVEIRLIDHDEGESTTIGTVGNDGSVEGDEEALRESGVMGYLDLVDDPSELLPILDGPRILAVETDGGPPDAGGADQKSWVPYEGPQGGRGWKDTDSGRVVYQDDPPGDVKDVSDMSVEELGEALAGAIGREEAQDAFAEAEEREDIEDALRNVMDQEGDSRPPEERADVGASVVLEDETGWVYDGTVQFIDSDWVEIRTPDGELVEAPREQITEVKEPADGQEMQTVGGERPSRLNVGDEVNIGGEEVRLERVASMGEGQYLVGENEAGEQVSARVAPSERLGVAGEGRGAMAAEDLGAGDEVVIDGQTAVVEGITSMGGGQYVVADADGELLSARLAAGEELEGQPGAPIGGTPSVSVSPGEPEPVEPSADDYIGAVRRNADRLNLDEDSVENIERLLGGEHADEYDFEEVIRDNISSISERKEEKVIKDAKRGPRFADNHAPDDLDPTRAREITDLADTDADTGITAAAMDVATMPDGSTVYVTHVSPDGRSHSAEAASSDAENATNAAAALDVMGVRAPDHHYEKDRFYSVEDVGGETVADAPWESRSEMDTEQATECMAAQVLIGNRDPHTSNVAVVDAEGGGKELSCFDLDLSLKETGHMANNNRVPSKAAMSLEKATDYRRGEARTLIAEEAERMAEEVDRDELRDAVSEEAAEVIIDNIEAWANRT